MKATYFSNTKGYNDTRFTDYIPDSARRDCLTAWKFAGEIGFGLNFHIAIEIPVYVTEAGQPAFQRMVANKLRVHADDNGFDAYQLMHRSCDPETRENARIDVLFHVPEHKAENFKKVVSNWSFVREIQAVTYDETVSADGLRRSAFNNLFGATSPEFTAARPDVPQKASGPVLGDRTFYSRSLWGKCRFLFWKAKKMS